MTSRLNCSEVPGRCVSPISKQNPPGAVQKKPRPLPGIFAFVADRGDNELMIMNDRGPASRELCGGASGCRVVGVKGC